MTLHHYLFEINASDKKYLLRIREELLNIGCSEKYSGDLGIFYTLIYSCRDDTVVSIGFSNIYYVDIYSRSGNIEKYLDILASVFPKNKVLMHYVIREI